MPTPTVYVICDNNCKYEGMTKEQTLAAIMQATETGTISNCDAGFITTVKTINGTPLKFFVGTQAEYNNLSDDDKQNLFAIITDDKNTQELLNTCYAVLKRADEIEKQYSELNAGLILGDVIVDHARSADYAYEAENANTAVEATNASYAATADQALATDLTHGVWKLADPEITLYDGAYEFEFRKGNKHTSFGVLSVKKGVEVYTPIILVGKFSYDKKYAMLKIGAEGTDEILIKLLGAIQTDDLLGDYAEVDYSESFYNNEFSIWYRRLR